MEEVDYYKVGNMFKHRSQQTMTAQQTVLVYSVAVEFLMRSCFLILYSSNSFSSQYIRAKKFPSVLGCKQTVKTCSASALKRDVCGCARAALLTSAAPRGAGSAAAGSSISRVEVLGVVGSGCSGSEDWLDSTGGLLTAFSPSLAAQ